MNHPYRASQLAQQVTKLRLDGLDEADAAALLARLRDRALVDPESLTFEELETTHLSLDNLLTALDFAAATTRDRVTQVIALLAVAISALVAVGGATLYASAAALFILAVRKVTDLHRAGRQESLRRSVESTITVFREEIRLRRKPPSNVRVDVAGGNAESKEAASNDADQESSHEGLQSK